jgi:hypothetical protein
MVFLDLLYPWECIIIVDNLMIVLAVAGILTERRHANTADMESLEGFHQVRRDNDPPQ